MSEVQFPTTAKAIAQRVGAEILGDLDRLVETVSSIQKAEKNSLVFLADKKFQAQLDKAENLTLLTTKDLACDSTKNTILVVENPKLAFSKIAMTLTPAHPWVGISPLASIHPTAKLSKGVSVGPYSVISEGAVIGENTVVYPHTYIGTKVVIGESCELHPHVNLLFNVTVGNRVKIFSGSVVGSEGFGFIESGGEHVAMPQIGRVVIEDDVRIGAHCTIDRGTLGETRIGRGSKLDDQVHVGHNAVIGKNCILCAQVALGGSCVLEDQVLLAGQVAIGDQVVVGKGAQLAGQSGVSTHVKGGERYFGSPAIPIRESFRILRASYKLPEILTRLKQLEEKAKSTP